MLGSFYFAPSGMLSKHSFSHTCFVTKC
uniref:Uncharacterized protein n=1 Tax=Arundo donax TaxID=35708 RepID=A0A0A9HVA2_ARUDO